MGPILDFWGLEQGGKNSSEFYKVYNNEQVETAQQSKLGVQLGGAQPQVISAIAQADDVCLLTNDIFSLQNLLQLSLSYCKKYHVTLSAEKTKLQVFSNNATWQKSYYDTVVSPLNIDGEDLPFVSETEHVGLIRSVHGNLPHILNRFKSHRGALFKVLPAGLAWGHRGNPAVALHVHKMHAEPVLLSGLGSLVLKKSEISMISQYLKRTVQSLQKLMDRTPPCVVSFLGGVLPGTAIIHKKQFSIFGMVIRNPGSIIHTHAVHILSSAKPSSHSWFLQIRELCLLYQLPHPLSLLEEPPTATFYNNLVKSKVVDYWEIKLRAEAFQLKSAPFFNPSFMSLTKPHPIWSTCGPNPFECHKAVTATRMLSGRYFTDYLQRHWTPDNKEGFCLLPTCKHSASTPLGNLDHLLLFCPALSHTRVKLLDLFSRVSLEHHAIASIVNSVFTKPNHSALLQLLLDCTTMPDVILATQVYGDHVQNRLLYLGRTWCYNIHRERMKLMNLLKFR